jgi:integrase/recombinase XerD
MKRCRIGPGPSAVGRRLVPPRDASLGAWIKRFLVLYLPQHRGAAMNTISSYGQALKSFHRFLGRRKGSEPAFGDITAENALAFLAELERKRGNGPATRNARLAAVFSFLRFAFLMGCIGREPYERLRHIAFKRNAARVPCHLDPPELEAVFRAVDHSTRDGFRDLVVLKILYNTGARASEVASLRISAFDANNLRLKITCKGGKIRVVSLWETTAALVQIYLASERRTPKKGYEDWLFISQRRTPLTRAGIYGLVYKYVSRAAEHCPSLAEKTVTPHTFRHTTGVHLVDSGVDLKTISDWLGHAHMASTEIYARPSLASKRDALERLQQLDRRLFREIVTARSVPKLAPGLRRWLNRFCP